MLKPLTYFAFIFGILTLISGYQNLFNAEVIKSQGNIIPLVLRYNFGAGFFYIITSVLVLKGHKLGLRLTSTLSSLNVVVFIYLLNYIYDGGAYQGKTVAAMSFRTIFWIVFFIVLSRSKKFSSSCHCG
jgi:hypothetical protein